MTKPKNQSHATHRDGGKPVSDGLKSKEGLNIDVMSLPDDELGFLLKLVKHAESDLTAVAASLQGRQNALLDWVRDRLVEARLLIALIEGPEFRRGYLDWCHDVCSQLEAIDTELEADTS